MPQIFAALSSPQSFLSAMGLPNGTTPTSAVVVGSSVNENTEKFLYIQGGFNLHSVSVAPITVQCNSQKLYVRLEATAWLDDNSYSAYSAVYGPSGQLHKLIKFVGADGLCKFSLGAQLNSYRDTAAEYDMYFSSKPETSGYLSLFSFAGANDCRPSKVIDGWRRPKATVTDIIEIVVDLTAAGSRSVKYKVNGMLVAELLDSELPAGLTSVASIVICDPAILYKTRAIGYIIGSRIATVLVADTEIPNIKTAGLVPTAFGEVNNFTGALSNITSPVQDSLFIATSAEIGQEVDLLFTFPADLAAVESIDMYFQGKYVQADGIAAKFSLALYDKTTKADISTPVIVTVPANQSDSLYLTYKVTTWVQNIVTSQKLTAADLANAGLRILIVEV